MGSVNVNSTCLHTLIGDIGRSYLRMSIPPPWLYVGVLFCGLALCSLSGQILASLAASVIASAALTRLWPVRRQAPSLLRWRLLTPMLLLALVVLAGFDWDWFGSRIADLLIFLAVLGYGAMAIRHVIESARFARSLTQYVAALDDQQLIQQLPPEVSTIARSWLAGEDGRTEDIAHVLHLAALWMSINAMNNGQTPPLSSLM